MEVIKTSDNVEFDVIYADGTRKRVHEGVLFEAEGCEMTFHNGTDRASVLFAAAESALAIIDHIGLTKLFSAYIRSDPEYSDTLRILARLKTDSLQISSAEKQAIFRLGQMDMRESVAAMLQDAGEEASGVVRASLLAAADLVGEMEVP